MNSNNQFDWVDFYKEFAFKLKEYSNSRTELIAIIRSAYESANIDLPTLEKDNQIVDIDPFTVFGLFNRTAIKQTSRVAIISIFAKLFDVKASVPSSFDGIPVLDNRNATFYYFISEREENDIEDLWNLFLSALNYADNQTPENRVALSGWFDKAIGKKGNGNSKITMGLFWINPDIFLNLDQRNAWYIYESEKLPDSFVSTLPKIKAKLTAADYFDISDKVLKYLESESSPFKDLKELSFEAWRYSEQVNQERKQEKLKDEASSKGVAVADDDVETTHYWIYSPGDNASIWNECYDGGFMAIGWDEIGDLKQYTSKDEMKTAMQNLDSRYSWKNAAHATWNFLSEMKPGDVIFAKKGMHMIVGRGVVSSDYRFDAKRSRYKNVRSVKWTNKGEWQHPGQAVMKTLTDITAYTDYVEKLENLFESETNDEPEEPAMDYPLYDSDLFLDEVFMDRESYEKLVALVQTKKNVILQGAPGVGKTFAAKRLAYSIMGTKDPNRVMMVQFHQSYSYEDFIMGFRLSESGFELKRGAFYNFCKKAEIDSENDYFFIIDEINRGNLSKIFGELFMLIENDKRGVELQLLYSDEKFSVPGNVYIIGMMNTADRSLAMLDYALRRRFAFFEMKPGFDTDGFRKYRMNLASDKFDHLINCVENLNASISSDESLGEGFCIGHSYFCNLKKATDQALSSIVEFELIPLLKEYWFDEPTKVKDWSNNLRSSLK